MSQVYKLEYRSNRIRLIHLRVCVHFYLMLNLRKFYSSCLYFLLMIIVRLFSIISLIKLTVIGNYQMDLSKQVNLLNSINILPIKLRFLRNFIRFLNSNLSNLPKTVLMIGHSYQKLEFFCDLVLYWFNHSNFNIC